MIKKLTLPLVIVAGVFSLSGCQIMPTFTKPTAPVPDSYPASDNSSNKAIADTGWNDFFQNPDLREAISTALKNNRNLKTAVLQIEEARDRRFEHIAPATGWHHARDYCLSGRRRSLCI